MEGPSTNLVINGVTYRFPLVGATDWGQDVSNWAIAASNGLLQKTGGLFSLQSELNFGVSFGVLAPYFASSNGSNPATTGVLRLRNGELIAWRNQANNANVTFGISSTNVLQINGSAAVSVNASGGTTGMSFTGGPITSTGTLTLTGTLGVANGGTGATTLSGLMFGNGTSAVTTVTPDVLGKVLVSTGVDTPPAWTTIEGTGTVVEVDTGTGLTGGPIVSSGTIALDSSSIASLALADSAVQPGDDISELNNDAGYITSASDASELTTGTLADARLSSNVPLKDAENTFSAASASTRTQQITNTQDGTGSAARVLISSSTNNVALFMTSPSYSSAVVTGGPTGSQAVLRTLGNYPIVFGTNNTERLRIGGDGVLLVKDDLRSLGQGRFTGWYDSASSNAEGLGLECGQNAGTSFVYSYNRASDVYGPLQLRGTTLTLNAAATTTGLNISSAGAVSITSNDLRSDVLYARSDTTKWLQANTSSLTYGGWMLQGSRTSYHGLSIYDGALYPTLMSNGTTAGVFSQGASKWLLRFSSSTNAVCEYNLQAVSFQATSSRESKDETGNITNAGQILSKLRPIKYRSHQAPEDEQLGLIAEEVHEICPELSTDGKSVRYDRLAMLLLADWQERHGVQQR